MKEFWTEMRTRWHNAMPRFFKRMMWICGLISGTALAAHESMALAGIQPHEWWLDIEPYLVAVPAGAMFACKFTQQYNGKPVDGGRRRRPKARPGQFFILVLLVIFRLIVILV